MEDKSYVRESQEVCLTRQLSVRNGLQKGRLERHMTVLGSTTVALIYLGFLSLLLSCIAQAAEPGKDAVRASVVVVYAGHTQSLNWNKNHQGVRSVSGIPEYKYNDALAYLFEGRSSPLVQYKIIPSTLNIPFQSRPDLAEILGAAVLVEIHHDSVQPQILSKLAKAAVPNPMLEYYRGFSLHVYPRLSSIEFAKSIESCMISVQIPYSQYHKDDLPGERMMLVEGTKAIYSRRNLYLLKHSKIPAVIVECGCIANPTEEALLRQERYKQRIVEAVCKGINAYLGSIGGNQGERKTSAHTPCRELEQ